MGKKPIKIFESGENVILQAAIFHWTKKLLEELEEESLGNTPCTWEKSCNWTAIDTFKEHPESMIFRCFTSESRFRGDTLINYIYFEGIKKHPVRYDPLKDEYTASKNL